MKGKSLNPSPVASTLHSTLCLPESDWLTPLGVWEMETNDGRCGPGLMPPGAYSPGFTAQSAWLACSHLQPAVVTQASSSHSCLEAKTAVPTPLPICCLDTLLLFHPRLTSSRKPSQTSFLRLPFCVHPPPTNADLVQCMLAGTRT